MLPPMAPSEVLPPIRMPPAPLLKLKPMELLPPNEISPPFSILNPTKEDRLLPPLPVPPMVLPVPPSPLLVPPPPVDVAQFEEPASLADGGRAGRDNPTRRRGNTEGGTTRSKPAVPMEKEGRGPRPARPRGGRPPGAGDLGWKAIIERPRRPRGGGRRPSSPGCGGAIGSGRRRDGVRDASEDLYGI